jgi:transcriptional regulator
MYNPAAFDVACHETMHGLIDREPFATLVTMVAEGPDANHLPFEFDPARGPFGTLRAHVARANPVWEEALIRPDALVIFQGPAAYVSPSWYPSKQETHRQVPTYNYMVVHARGRIVVHEDEAFVRGVVARLTRKMEAAEIRPWKIGDSPPDFIAQMLTKIVGIEIEVTKLVGKWKLGQNRETRDRAGAANELRSRSGDAQRAVGDAMLTAVPGDRMAGI